LSDLRADDLNRDAILSQGGASSEADVLAWAESAEEFSLAELFSADALKSFRVAPWRGAKTLVAMLNEASATAVSRGQRDDPPSVGGGSSAPP
jgi:prolyl-tRNA editing enzyme YbaK/EbsC (Cys-tRNA(Pro) deacylase)